jgi:hypothetical protein
MKKSIYDRALRRWRPKKYIHMMMRRREIEHREKLKTVSSADRQELEVYYNFEMSDLDDWLTSIQDEELIEKATQMDLSLDDIPMPDCAPDERPSHWDKAQMNFGTRVLYSDTRRALQMAIRERAPAYRKERREVREFYLKLVLGLGSAATGVGGTIIGIIASLSK